MGNPLYDNVPYRCPRCGHVRNYRDTKKEYTGMRVCIPCWDPKPSSFSTVSPRPIGVVPDGSPRVELTFISEPNSKDDL